MRHPLVTAACAASLALLLTATAVWVRSYRAADSLSLVRRFGDPDAPGHGYTSLSLSWSMGTISLGGGTVLDRLPPDERRVTWSSLPAGRLVRPQSPWLRFRFFHSGGPERPTHWSRGTIVRHWRLTMPCWTAALAAGGLPVWWAARRWTARRADRWAARGRCARCGYDLRATPGRCPECGATTGEAA